MEKKVLAFITTNQLIKRHSKVMIAISGGPDSLALLHFLWQKQTDLAIDLIALTIDHGLREEAKEDVTFVKKLCAEWEIPCIVEKVDVPSYMKTYQVGTQVAARNLRYEVFRKQMEKHAADYLALGHHADDQLETVLMALSKTTHLHNLGGMPLKRSFAAGHIIRPFLSVSKQEIGHYIDHHQLIPRIDQSNFTNEYTRNRLRQEVVPYLKAENPNLLLTIQKLTENLREDDALLMKEATRIFNQAVDVCDTEKKAAVSVPLLREHPVPLQRRVFRLTLDYLYGTIPKQIAYKHEEILLALLQKSGNKLLHFPEQLRVEKAYEHIYCYFHHVEKKTHLMIDHVPQQLLLPNGAQLQCSPIDRKSIVDMQGDPNTYIFPNSVLKFPLTVRSRLPGDRMTYKGLKGTKKIKDILIDEKIPRHIRNECYVLTDVSGEILWLIGLKKNERIQNNNDSYICIKYAKE